jgi:hypothetical protein
MPTAFHAATTTAKQIIRSARNSIFEAAPTIPVSLDRDPSAQPSPNPPNVLVPGMGASSVREWIALKSQRDGLLDAAGRAGGEGYVGLTLTRVRAAPVSPVAGQSDFARLGRLTTLLPRSDPQ